MGFRVQLPIHQLLNIWLFLLLAIMSHAAINIWILYGHVFNCLGYIPRCRIFESLGSYLFNILKKYQTVFQNCCIILHSHQKCMRVSISLQLCILLSVKWYFIIVLICILMILSIFSCTRWHLYIFLGEISIQIHNPFLTKLFVLLLSWKFPYIY